MNCRGLQHRGGFYINPTRWHHDWMKGLLIVLLITSAAVARVVTVTEIVKTTAVGIAVDGFDMLAYFELCGREFARLLDTPIFPRKVSSIRNRHRLTSLTP